VTYEFENVPGDILIPLCGKYNIPQGYKPLYDSQDRLREKSNARDHGLRTPGFEAVDDEASLREAVRRLGLPAVLKTRTLGYDGHGQRVLKTEADIAGALPLLAVPCILEEFVPFDSEASIVMVADGERVVSFPVGSQCPPRRDSGFVHRTCRSRFRGAGAHEGPERAFHARLRLSGHPGHRVFHQGR